ncbi:MAG: ABC transporter ATP-binding protein [Clostridium sp.]|jgi:putative ABC transport system ATP-binding protein|nr:ABC transporter ATP-binding protein [Clostridium sp.]
MKTMIQGKSIVKTFGKAGEKTTALAGVDITVMEGEFVAVMGASGSGKSTLLYSVSGMDSIDSGSVMFDGKELSELGENELSDVRRTKMGFVFQQPTMLKNLNLLDNIILSSAQENRKNAAALVDQAKSLMEKAGINGLESRDITEVSGGQLQRAGICRALMSRPKVLFGDEPTCALNSAASSEIMQILSEINADGTTIMLVTHDPRIAAVAEKVLFMRDGKIETELQLSKYSGSGFEGRINKVSEKMMEIGV